MKVKRLFSFSLALIFFLINVFTIQAQADSTLPSGIAYSDIGSEIEKYVEENKDTTCALAVSVFDSNGIIYENYFGYADRENSLPVDKNTVIEWGSVSKALVWTSLMQLEEEGKIDFNTDVRTYLPDGVIGDLKYDKPITIMNLFNHDAGLQDFITELFVKPGSPYSDLEGSLRETWPGQIFEPGYVTGYSNWSTALGGLIVEEVTGMSFADYVHENIFEPLDMEDTALLPDLSDNPSVKERRKDLKCYTAGGDLIGDAITMITLYPAGMATGTLEDLRKFTSQFVISEGEKSLLFKEEETLDKMLSPTKYYGDTGIGMNFHGLWSLSYGVQTIGHGGNSAGCSSMMVFDPISKVGVVVMTNQASEYIYNYKMMELIYGKFSESTFFPETPEPVPGLFESARTIRNGPFKFYSISVSRLSGQGVLDQFWTYQDTGSDQRVTMAFFEFLKVPPARAIVTIVLVCGFLLAGLVALYSLVRSTISLVRTDNLLTSKKMSSISVLASLLILASLINFALIVRAALTFQSTESFRKFYIFGAILIVLLVVFAILLFKGTFSLGKGKKGKVRYFLTGVFSTLTVLFMIYYNLYMFWEL